MTQVGTKDVPTPECDKALKVKNKSQAIGEFLEWLQEKGIRLASYGEERDTRSTLWTIQKSTEVLLAEFFEIDLAAMEQEKRAILAALREIDG